ncbi:MAG: peptidyl-prolyl cis-trans isomerase [Lentisphaeria bacterium]|nr:peptidyl-prolyl cis-trans isomerase [Lentisphaeria bacterium]MBQ7404662.1 peptidyl-prolyl cis-trans isomerase [Lentisphaeria bacterium]
MAITKINNVLVKHGKIMFAVITAIIIVSFVWFFTPGTSGSILFNKDPNSPNAVCGEVFGTSVQNKDVSRIINDMTLFHAMQANVSPNPHLFNISYDQAFMLAMFYAAAEKLGVVVNDDDVVALIRECPTFKKDNTFNADAYIAYEKEKLQPAGYTEQDLQNAIRTILTVESLASLAGDVIVPPAELAEFVKTFTEKHEVLSITFNVENFKKGINPTEQDLLTFYNNNKNLFMIPESYKAEAVLFRYAIYESKAAVTPAEIKKYYDDNKASFVKDGKQQTLQEVTAMITTLLKTQKKRAAAMAAATALREEIYKETADIAGDKAAYLGKFQDVVKKFPGGKVTINWFTASDAKLPTVGKDDALKNALVAQSKSNVPVTDPVLGENGVYVAAIVEVQPAKVAEFAAIKDKVRAAYINQTALVAANEAMRTFAAALIAEKNPDTKKIQQLAKGGTVKAFAPFSLFPGSQDVSPEISSLASNTATGKLSETYDSPAGPVAVFVLKRTPSTDQETGIYKQLLEFQYKMIKQQIVSTNLQEWISKNIKNYMQQSEDQAQQ